MSGRFEAAWRARRSNFPPVIGFDYPLKTARVSVTGDRCDLRCPHCNGHYLRGMVPISSAREYVQKHGMRTALVSGGCSREGKVPLLESVYLIDGLKEVAALNVHPGIVGEGDAERIARFAGRVSLDLVFDEEAIKLMLGDACTPDDFVRSYQVISRRAQVIPHVLVGVRAGKVVKEYETIDFLKSVSAPSVVFLVLIPTRGTGYEGFPPPPLEEVIDVLLYARRHMPSCEISLGCMRPGGRYRMALDVEAIKAGVNRVVLPSKPAVEEASKLNLVPYTTDVCCAFSLSGNHTGRSGLVTGAHGFCFPYAGIGPAHSSNVVTCHAEGAQMMTASHTVMGQMASVPKCTGVADGKAL